MAGRQAGRSRHHATRTISDLLRAQSTYATQSGRLNSATLVPQPDMADLRQGHAKITGLLGAAAASATAAGRLC